jgi:hypothetical protein
MAEQDSILTSPPTKEDAVHVRDYTRFTKLFKWGAIVSAVTALVVILIIAN